MALKLGNNPLAEKNRKNPHFDDDAEIKTDKIVRRYGRMVHLNKAIIKNVDFSDKAYINRIYIDFNDLELRELKESIREIGLINIIYLQERDDSRLRIISGLRRLTASKELYDEGIEDLRGKDRVIILGLDTPTEYLDKISIDENIKRKNLSILEQSYKFNREANRKNKSIDEILQEYHISKKSFYRIKNAIDYPLELKNIIEEIGADKAEIINKLIAIIKPEDVYRFVEDLKHKKRDDLREILKDNKTNTKALKVELKIAKTVTSLKIRKKLPKEVLDYLNLIREKIENDDYSFIK